MSFQLARDDISFFSTFVCMTKHGYIWINGIFAGIILAIFVYSIIYKPNENEHPIKCIHQELLGGKCPTCGMSRGFSALIRGHVDDALAFQQNCLSVFFFFGIQLVFRISIIIILIKTRITAKFISNIDITLSLLLFLFTFRNLILQTIYIFYKMLLTGNIT